MLDRVPQICYCLRASGLSGLPSFDSLHTSKDGVVDQTAMDAMRSGRQEIAYLRTTRSAERQHDSLKQSSLHLIGMAAITLTASSQECYDHEE